MRREFPSPSLRGGKNHHIIRRTCNPHRSGLTLYPLGYSVWRASAARCVEVCERRALKIWELSSTLHCSIVGTCLTASELRRFFVRFGDDGARTASDHDLHGRGVVAASRRDDGGKLLNKALDKRHEAALRRFAKAETAAQLLAAIDPVFNHYPFAL